MLILKNATVVNFHPPEVHRGWDIVIENDLIAAAGPGAAEGLTSDEIWDLKGAIVHPGLVCSHNHFYSGLARGILADLKPSSDFISVLKNLWWRLDRSLDRESLESSALICCLDAIRSGTTAVIDHHASPSFIDGSLTVLKKAFEQAGLRGMTCYETTDRNSIEEMESGIAENIRFAKLIDEEKAKGQWSGLIEAHIGGHAPFTLPDRGLELLAEASEKTGRGFHCHAGEDRYDASRSHHEYGKDLLERLDDFGLMNSKTLIVHGLYLSSRDREIMNQRNSYLAVNFRSNMNNAVGVQQYLGEVKNIALGTDGIGSDMWEEFKFTYFKHKDAGGPLWPGDMLGFLHNGNILLERNFEDHFGKVEKGFKADLVISDYQPPTPLKAENMAGHIAFGLSSNSVRSVLINGKTVLKDRTFPFETEPVYAESREQALRLWEQMNKLSDTP